MSDNQCLLSELLNCKSPALVKVAAALENLPENTLRTAKVEKVVCTILLQVEDPSKSCVKSMKEIVQEPSATLTCFKKLCEISYHRFLNEDADVFLGRTLSEVMEMMKDAPTLSHFLDPRTMCGVYPPAPKANIYLPAVAILEHFFAAVHLLFQSKSEVMEAANFVLRKSSCEDILVFYCGLAAKKVSSAASKILPELLDHLQQAITMEDVKKISSRLLTVVNCLHEAKDPQFLHLIRGPCNNFDVRECHKAACPLYYFLRSKRGQWLARSCPAENYKRHLDNDKENRSNTQHKKSRTLLPRQAQGLVMVQPSSDRMTSSTKEDLCTTEVNLPMPQFFAANETDEVSLTHKAKVAILSTHPHKCFDNI